MKQILFFCLTLTVLLAGASHHISIPEVGVPPQLDGEDADGCWKHAAVVFGLVDSKTHAPAEEATVMRLVKSGDALYGFVYCEQKDAEKLAIRGKRENWEVNPIGSVELFFTNDSSVFQFILDYSNEVFEQELLPDLVLGTRPGKTLTSGMRVRSKVHSDSWTVEFALPLNALQLKGDSFGLNVVRNNVAAKETSAWMLLRKPRFRQWAAQYEHFPKAVFCKEGDRLFTVSGSRVTAAHDLENTLADGRTATIKEGTPLAIDPERAFSLNLVKDGQSVYRFDYNPPEQVTLSLGDNEITWPVLHFSPFMPCQITWQSNHSFSAEANAKDIGRVHNDFEIVFDVPEGMEVLNGLQQPQTTPGRRVFVQKLSSLSRTKFKNRFQTLFGCTLKPGTKEVLRYQVRWPEGKTTVHEIPIASVEVRPAEPPKKVIVGFYGTRDSWTEELRKVGVNLMCSPYYRHDEKELKDLLRLKEKGFKIAYSSTQDIPFGSGVFFSKWTENDRSTRTIDSNGREVINPKSKKYQISPSYRGKLFQDGLAATREYCQKAGFQYYIFDTEDHFQGAGQLGDFSERTLQWFERWFKEKQPGKEFVSPLVFERDATRYPDYHQMWFDFKCEIWADFFQKIKENMNTTGEARFIDYGMRQVDEETCHQRLTDYHWLQVFDGGIGGAWYSSVDLSARKWGKVYDEMRHKWSVDPIKAVWICPSRLVASHSATIAPPVKDEMKCKFFEAMTLGARSYIIFSQIYMDMDSVRQLADAMRVLSQCEDVVYYGKRIETITTDVPYWPELSDYFKLRQLTVWEKQPRVLVKGLEHENKALITVSEYREQVTREVRVFYAFKNDSMVKDLETGAIVASPKAGDESFAVTLDDEHCCRIFLVASVHN